MSEVIDNKANRIRVLKDIIKHLHAGNPPEQVQRQMREIVRQTDASEIMAMEQELMAEGMPVEEVRSMCDLHSKVTRDVLVQLPIRKAIAPGHPVDTFRRENEALRGAIAAMTQTLAELQSTKEAADAAAILVCTHARTQSAGAIPPSECLAPHMASLTFPVNVWVLPAATPDTTVNPVPSTTAAIQTCHIRKRDIIGK
jgi:Family of unknown function (DUF438)